MPFVLGNSAFERLVSFGLTVSFMGYMQREYHMSQVQAPTILNTLYAATNFAPIIGGFFADALIGKFWTIVFGSFSSLLGMMIMTLTAMMPQLRPPPCSREEQQHGQCIGSNTAQLSVLTFSMIWLAIGTGGVKPCRIPFSVDQFDLTTEEGRKGTNSFYNLYYTSQTVVLLITQTVVIYIQNDISWALGFGIPTFAMLCAIVLFLLGTRIYIYVKPEGSIFAGIAQVFVAAYKKRNYDLPTDGLDCHFYDPLASNSEVSKLPLTTQYRFLNKAALIVDAEDSAKADGSAANPWGLCSIQLLEDVKRLINIIPIWLTSILSFVAMNQQGTSVISQALKMDLHLTPSFQMPAGSTSVIPLIDIALSLPFYERVLVPALENFTKQEGGITLLQRIGIGNIFAIFTMFLSGIIEKKERRELALTRGGAAGIASMTVMWLTPPLVMIGLSEIFSIVGLIEFYNRQFPQRMRSMGNTLFYLTFSVSSYASTGVISIVESVTEKTGSNWLTDDVNTSKLDYFYFLLAGLSFLNFVVFIFCARSYNYRGSVNKIQITT